MSEDIVLLRPPTWGQDEPWRADVQENDARLGIELMRLLSLACHDPGLDLSRRGACVVDWDEQGHLMDIRMVLDQEKELGDAS